VEISPDLHALSGNLLAQQCASMCSLNHFFGIVLAAIVNCHCLSIGSCAILDTVSAEECMTLYFYTGKSDMGGQEQMATVRNFLVEEDDVPFSFDIILSTFKASSFELFKDDCGTNMYKVQTEVSQSENMLDNMFEEITSYATLFHLDVGRSLEASMGATLPIKIVKVAIDISAKASLEVSTALESSAASQIGSRIFTSFGVKRLTEVLIPNFDTQRNFVTLNEPFRNLLHEYLLCVLDIGRLAH